MSERDKLREAYIIRWTTIVYNSGEYNNANLISDCDDVEW